MNATASRHSHSAVWNVLLAALLAALLAVLVFMLFVPCRQASALYSDVADEYPASQDVAASGTPLSGSQIPAGTYRITASTSSYMCRITDCTLSVGSDGSMSVTFTISKAYTAIYFGTAEEAAAHTDATGTDASAYYLGDPATGYVPHKFTVPLQQVNVLLKIATYNAGTKGFEKAVWYTREVVFNFDESMAVRGPDDPPQGDSGTGGSGMQDGGSGTAGGKTGQGIDATDGDRGEKGTTAKTGSSGQRSASKSKKTRASASATASATGSSGFPASARSVTSNMQDGVDDGGEDSDAGSSGLSARTVSGGLQVVPLRVLGQDVPVGASPYSSDALSTSAHEQGGWDVSVVALVLMAFAAAGLAAASALSYLRRIRPALAVEKR